MTQYVAFPLPSTAFKLSSGVQLRKAVTSLLQNSPTGVCATSDVTSAASISSALKRKWYPLSVPAHELRLDITLTNGQSFGWKRYPLAVSQKVKQEPKDKIVGEIPAAVPMAGEAYFYGVIGSYALLLKQTPTDTHYQVLNNFNSKSARETQRIKSVLQDYFQLKTNLKDLYSTWQASGNKRFASILLALPGMRILRQDPAECLFSFICSSNNNIGRIILMLDRLRERYGDMLWVDDELGIKCYSFPPIARLAEATEEELRALGLGYRAPWIRAAAITLHHMSTDSSSAHASGLDFLFSLRTLGQKAVQDALIGFKGVGRKVADCIALFSLDQPASIPVDTHVWQVRVGVRVRFRDEG